jgi:hypothetical protein
VPELGDAAADFDFHVADLIGHGRDGARRCRRRLVSVEEVGGAGGEPDPEIVVSHDGRAGLVEQLVPVDVIAMIVSTDHVFDRQRRDFCDGGLDLVVERRVLAVHHDDAIGADSDGDVAALTHQHIGLVAEIDGRDFDLGKINTLSICRGCKEHGCAGHCGDLDQFHGRCPP